MSVEFDPARADLVVVITRLHADRGSPNDEFERDWVPPGEGLSHNSGVVPGHKGANGYWVRTEDRKAAVLVVHGHKKLISGGAGSLEAVVLQHLDQSGLKGCSFSMLALFVHGDVLSGDSRVATPPDGTSLLHTCHRLSNRFPGGWKLYDYSLRGQRPAALQLPLALRTTRVDEKICALTETLFNIAPAVELVVRSMQHILLEVRLWCDLYSSHKEMQPAIETRLSDCHIRLMGHSLRTSPSGAADAPIAPDNWSNAHLCEARSFLCDVQTLSGFLKMPSRILFRLDDDNLVDGTADGVQQDGEPLRVALFELYEQHGGAEFLDCDENISDALGKVLDQGQLSETKELPPSIDRGLRALSGRLEALIPAAVAVDDRRRKAL